MTDKEISAKTKGNGELSSIPYGMIVWSTGIGTRPVIKDFMKQIGQVFYSWTNHLEFLFPLIIIFFSVLFTTIRSVILVLFIIYTLQQGSRRVLATDEWLRVEGTDSIYALGDCATINQRRVMVPLFFVSFFKSLISCILSSALLNEVSAPKIDVVI